MGASPLHHDYWVPVGGFGEAALALLGEIPEAAAWAAQAKHLFDAAFDWLGDDGAWHEGVADWCYAMAPLLMFYGAGKRSPGKTSMTGPGFAIPSSTAFIIGCRLTNT